ncbi:MAG: carboxypeptidase-like regulatory domain-containing protein, partial [Acidobacteriota bacterium]
SAVPISSIAISPQDDNYRFVGLNNGGLLFTTTGSSVLTVLDPVGGGVIPDFYVARIAFDPTNKNTVYIALGNYGGGTAPTQSHVWKVTNLGTVPVITALNGTGGNILPDVPVNGFAVEPTNSSKLYAGTDIGVFASTDGGVNWSPFGTGLPRVAVFDMAIVPGASLLRIATHGRGMWQISTAPAAAFVTVGGLVRTSDLRPLRSAVVSLKNMNTSVVTKVTTSATGLFTFDNVAANVLYTISVNNKLFRFNSQQITPTDNVTNLVFDGHE